MCCIEEICVDVCNCDVFKVVNMYLDHLHSVLCVFMVEDVSVVVNVMLSLASMMSPPPDLCDISVHTMVKLYFRNFALGVSLVD